MNQYRKYLKFSWKNHIRLFLYKYKLGTCGGMVFFDDNVKIMRFVKNIKILDNVSIKEGARICACNENASITIGKNTTIGYNSFIFASEKIDIGDDCLIAPFVYIVDSNHGIKKHKKINQQSNETSPIEICSDVWVGSSVTILKGVRIGNGAVIAANSVVTKNVNEYEIVAGSPARKIGNRI